jgi:hypothetical protein
MDVIGAASRTGFETAIDVATTEPCVAVRALDVAGVALGTSEIDAPRE